MQTDARAVARAMAHAMRSAPKDPYAAAIHTLTVPALVPIACRHLDPGPQLLYRTLWDIGRTVTRCPLPRWFYQTDDALTRATGIATRSLRRYRDALDAADLLRRTVATPQARPTYYLLTWPPPLPPAGATNPELGIYAEEIAAHGPALAGWQAWAALAARACPAHVADAAAAVAAAALRRRLPDLSTMRAIGDAWLCLQLRVLVPAHYHALYQPQLSLLSAPKSPG